MLLGPAGIASITGQIAVSVMNVSPSGIMLEIPGTAVIPALFTLVIGEHRHPCELIWRNGTRAGARLISPPTYGAHRPDKVSLGPDLAVPRQTT